MQRRSDCFAPFSSNAENQGCFMSVVLRSEARDVVKAATEAELVEQHKFRAPMAGFAHVPLCSCSTKEAPDLDAEGLSQHATRAHTHTQGIGRR